MSRPLDHVPEAIAHMALRKLADSGTEALRMFEKGEFDAAWVEVHRAREATNALMKLKRETSSAVIEGDA